MVDEICWRDADLVPIHIWRSPSAENDVDERVGNAIRYIQVTTHVPNRCSRQADQLVLRSIAVRAPGGG
jgi:hypothetical protein